MDLNKVIIVGRVTADVQLKTTPGGQSVCSIGVATNRTWTDKNDQKQQEVEFHNVVFWGRQAEVAAQYLGKGSIVLVEGRIRTRTWQDKQGNNRKSTEIMSERMQLGPRPAQTTAAAPARSVPTQKRTPATTMPPLDDQIPMINLDEEIKPEDIPF